MKTNQEHNKSGDNVGRDKIVFSNSSNNVLIALIIIPLAIILGLSIYFVYKSGVNKNEFVSPVFGEIKPKINSSEDVFKNDSLIDGIDVFNKVNDTLIYYMWTEDKKYHLLSIELDDSRLKYEFNSEGERQTELNTFMMFGNFEDTPMKVIKEKPNREITEYGWKKIE